ncbi:hypothetical protein COCNU_01G001740 [Cocos nucifera]|uniref:Uncharacterized protein n=1 Tax=Cocos nucifera TaxID=13894 RepID=A0A8K0HU60_COCNU|nr:hypothetical protein COCNU_01G001740 [Cocos nucifera]
MRCGAVAKCSIFPFLPAVGFARGWKWEKAGRMTVAIAARLGREDPDLLLRAALKGASLRFQETLRPDPLFVDPYASCLLSPNNGHQDMGEQPPVLTTTLSPYHYRLATKFLDDKLLSLVSSMDELRQATVQKCVEKLFMSHGFRSDVFDYGEVAKNMLLDPPSGAYENVLFIAEQLRLSDAQAMQQPQAAAPPKNLPSGCQELIPRRHTWVSRPITPGKEKQRAEESCFDHDSSPEETFPIYSFRICD